MNLELTENLRIRISRYISYSRLSEVSLMVGFPMVGVIFALEKITVSAILRIAWFAVAMFLLFLSIYGFNRLLGWSADQNNLRLKQIHRRDFSKLIFLTIILLKISLAIYLILDFRIFLLGTTSYLLWAAYSLPRIGFKNFPVVGTLIHFWGQVIHFQMGYILLQPVTLFSLTISIYFALLFAGGHLYHELIDYEADRQAGIKTTAVFFGRQHAFWFCYIVFILSGIYWLYLYLSGLLVWWEAIPFLVAFCAQIITLIYFRKKNQRQFDFLLKNQTLYRIYYFFTGIVFTIFKLFYLGL